MYNIPDPSKKEVVADWAEFYILATESELSKDQLRSFIEGSSGSEPSDDYIIDIWTELEKREKLYGENPPFVFHEGLIQPSITWGNRLEYMTCLIFSLEGNPIDPLKSGILFERIVKEAAAYYLNGQSIPVGFPDTYKAEEIAAALRETFVHEPPEFRQDRNLDVVAWKPFGDDRPNQVVVLIQCAAGHNWSSKMTELSLNAWCKYIHFACIPVRGFAMPILVTDEIRWEENSWDAGLIFDRARIYRNITIDRVSSELNGDLNSWCSARLADMMS